MWAINIVSAKRGIRYGRLHGHDLFLGIRKRLVEALEYLGLPALGGFDVSGNEHQAHAFVPHWMPHAWIIAPGRRARQVKADLGEWFPATETVPRPLHMKRFDGAPLGFAYALKPDFARRISPEPRTLEDGRQVHVQHPQEADLGSGARRTGPRARSGRPRRAALPPGLRAGRLARRRRDRPLVACARATRRRHRTRRRRTAAAVKTRSTSRVSQAAERRSADHATARRPRRRSQRQTNKAGSLATALVAERHQSSTRRGRFATSGVVAGRASQSSANADRIDVDRGLVEPGAGRTPTGRSELEPLTQARPAPVIVAPEPSVIRVNAAFPVIPGRNTKGVGAPAVDVERRVNDDRRRSPQLVESSAAPRINQLNSEEGKWLQTEK